ncbi:MAG: hypothetical protein JWR22_1010 [Herminiimonas sp.]|nr:hypothetical protein [Herminiimonas sp.]
MLEREALATRLTQYVDRLHRGAVIAIDAPWGEGKSWFRRHWAKTLEADHRVVYLDAFDSDYVEDPFLLIAAELAKVLDDSKGSGEKIRSKAAAVMTTLLPLGTKVAIGLASRVVGAGDVSDDFKKAVEAAQKGTEDAAVKWVKRKLETYDADRASLGHFRNQIAEYAKTKDKPVVFFIDELDRCRPSFAVRLLERVKHFFEVPNVVFVLLLNRDQLEKAVQGVYGEKTDASAYLQKFVNFFLSLPRPNPDQEGCSSHLERFIRELYQKHGIEKIDDNRRTFIQTLAAWATVLPLTLREIEKAVTLYILANEPQALGACAFLLVLKLRAPSIANKYLVSYKVASAEALVWLRAEISDKIYSYTGHWPRDYFNTLIQAVEYMENPVAIEAEQHMRFRAYVVGDRHNVDLDQVFARVARQLDLRVS